MGKPITQGFVTFAAISGTGWMIDILATMLLVNAGASPFLASLLGAALAVFFVYVTSRLVLFTQSDLGDGSSFLLYSAWQVVAISAASWLVSWLAFRLEDFVAAYVQGAGFNALTLSSGIAKALVTPLTLTGNFLFLRWLTQTYPKAKGRAGLQ